jgi:hypothetical protein
VVHVYRKGGPLVDPDTNRTLATKNDLSGTAQVTRPGEPATVILVAQSRGRCRGQAGRRRPRAAAAICAARADQEHQGRVMSIYGGMTREWANRHVFDHHDQPRPGR